MQLALLLSVSLACLASSAPRPFHVEAWDAATAKYLKLIEGRRKAVDHILPHILSCNNYDLSTAQMPQSSLPSPSEGLQPYHVALGRGTQNYTCQSFAKNQTAVPVAAGAVATLYNISCHATLNDTISSCLSRMAIHERWKRPSSSHKLRHRQKVLALAGATAKLTGNHYFSDPTTAAFNMNVDDSDELGIAFVKKVNATAAPKDDSLNGPGLDGNIWNASAVPWLKLNAVKAPALPSNVLAENSGGVKEVYRVNTVGGSPPADCSGFPEGGNFTVEYAAEYWFWH